VSLVASTDIKLNKFKGEIISFNDVHIKHDVGIWTAIWAPEDTPDDVMSPLVEILGIMAEAPTRNTLARGYGVTPIWKPSDEAAAYIATPAESIENLAKLVKEHFLPRQCLARHPKAVFKVSCNYFKLDE